MTKASSDSHTYSDIRKTLLNQIAASAKVAGQLPDTVTLTAVSKVQPDNRIQAMLDAGQTVYGENRVQEAQKRWGETFKRVRNKVELRLIGPLQSNKAQEACDLFDVIETLDREKLAKVFAKIRENGTQLPRLLVQVNTGEEPQKAGLAPKDVAAFLKLCRETYDLHPEGLMCIPPQGEAASPHFWLLNQLAQDNDLSVLSMGMSADFETAIKMGATHVRIGTALFGERDTD